MDQLDHEFPVKHITLNLDDDLDEFTDEKLVREFLRVGGAHKPNKYVFGPGQEFEP